MSAHTTDERSEAAVDVPRIVLLSVTGLKSIAGARCCDIFDDFTEDEAKRQPFSIYEAQAT